MNKKEYLRNYYLKHKEKILEQQKQRYIDNKEQISEYQKQYYKTPIRRAKNLLNSYKINDKKANRGECTLTEDFIINNIFTSHCIYCGETDWHNLGCDRIDNTKPHTPDNVVCCCGKCNVERGTKQFDEYLESKSK